MELRAEQQKKNTQARHQEERSLLQQSPINWSHTLHWLHWNSNRCCPGSIGISHLHFKIYFKLIKTDTCYICNNFFGISVQGYFCLDWLINVVETTLHCVQIFVWQKGKVFKNQVFWFTKSIVFVAKWCDPMKCFISGW